jgi:hypothetical protein
MTLSALARERLGMTLAVWFPADMPAADALGFLRQTLDDVELFVRPEHCALVVDGCPTAVEPARDAAREVARRCGGAEPPVVVNEVNEGQGGAVACGLEWLLENPPVQYLCTRDSDGDHDIYDVPQLLRRVLEVEDQEGTDAVFGVGARGDLHRPMGYARGELEGVLNEVTLTALTAAGYAPRLQHCRLHGPWPDLQSGFKLYTRRTAGLAARSLREAHLREPEILPLRWGVQFVTTTELLRDGAIPVTHHRLTYDQQPQTTFEGADDLARAYGVQIAWLMRRLQMPPERAWPILDAALCATLYATTPGGWETLLALREYVAREAWDDAPPLEPRRGAMF